MTRIAWETTHVVETKASPAFTWNYWTNVANWDDPPAKFELDGPFADGARGTTRFPDQPPMNWSVRDVVFPTAATIEIRLDGATLSFEWRFEEVAAERTRLTRRIVLRGHKAEAYVQQVKLGFAVNLADAMNKMAAAMAIAYASGRGKNE